jgi:Leucine-rich repeat (LRR) protein
MAKKSRSRSFALILLALAAFVSCRNPALQSITPLTPTSLYKPSTARVPYWYFVGSAGSYRYVVYQTGTALGDPIPWTSFDATDSTACPVSSDIIALLYASGTWPRGPARLAQPERIYLFAPSSVTLTEGASYSIKVQQSIDGGWNEVSAGTVIVDTTAPAAPVASSSNAPESVGSYKPSWSWTGPSDAVSFLGTLSCDSTAVPAQVFLQSATAAASGLTSCSFLPSANLPLDKSWSYNLEVRSIDAAGNRSAALEIPKLAIAEAGDLSPTLSAGSSGGPYGQDSQGRPATTSHLPQWTWTLKTLADASATKFRYQLIRDGQSVNELAWREPQGQTPTARTTTFTAGTDLPDSLAASTAAQLATGAWTLEVEAYYPVLQDWSAAGSLTIVVSSALPSVPVFSTPSGKLVCATTNPWWAWTVGDTNVSSLGYSLSYPYLDTTASPNQYKQATITGTFSPTKTTFVPADVSLAHPLSSGSATLSLWTIDAEGSLSASSSSTIVVDVAAPKLLGIARGSQATSSYFPLQPGLTLTFSEGMDPAALAASVSIAPTSTGTPIPASAYTLTPVDSTDSSFTLTVTSDLVPNTAYGVAVGAGATDLAGNALAAAGSLVFTTGTPVAYGGIAAIVTDPNLLIAIKQSAAAMTHAQGGVYLQDITTITYDMTEALSASHTNDTYNVTDLTGIDLCVSLTQLTLVSNAVPAADSMATTISTYEPIAHTAKLAACTKLQKLVLKGYTDAAGSFSFLSSLSSLFYLNLSFDVFGDTAAKQLDGLTKLTTLILADAGITSCSDVAKLAALTFLDISDNAVADSSFANLSSLTSLQTLLAPRNKLTSGSNTTIQNMTQLTGLYLCGNELSALPNFASLPDLIAARFKGEVSSTGTATLVGAASLAGANLDNSANPNGTNRYLDLSSNGISSLSGTYSGKAGAASLEKIDLSSDLALASIYLAGYPSLADIDVTGCASLASVDIETCPSLAVIALKDTAGSGTVSGLAYDASASPLGSLSSFKVDGCASLASVDLSGCSGLATLAIKNCPALPNVAALPTTIKSVDLSGCTRFTSPSAIVGLSFLAAATSLSLSGCTAITNVTGLPASLKTIDLSGCAKLTDLTGLSSLSAPTSLSLNGCIALTAVTGLPTSLATIDLTGCAKLSDITGLNSLTSPTSITLTGCSLLTKTQVDALKAKFPTATVVGP